MNSRVWLYRMKKQNVVYSYLGLYRVNRREIGALLYGGTM
jgi:hypothetical protein